MRSIMLLHRIISDNLLVEILNCQAPNQNKSYFIWTDTKIKKITKPHNRLLNFYKTSYTNTPVRTIPINYTF